MLENSYGDNVMEMVYVITKQGIAAQKDNLSSIIIREISSKEELEELIDRMPYIQTIQAPNSKARKELYQCSMEEYNDLEWIKIIKSVYLRMQDKRYDEYEPAYAERAKKFLYQEIAIQYNIPFDSVEQFLCETIENQLKTF
ncbi:hypothetical protein DW886_06800 [Enterocloster aldenensis]|uniref:hypothetical protein n=1 Tax=Enterocloster aldenensis TaxID=358742 RepID=UPI000E4F2023|nr:hypothetical protein DW886_06800 [Enterocloster aldenensis]